MSGLSLLGANASVPRVPGAPSDRMIVHVNGAERELPTGTTVAELLVVLGVEGGRVAVERNHDVVPRKDHALVTLVAGDRLEVVAFVGGG